jgi:hypothetical protein
LLRHPVQQSTIKKEIGLLPHVPLVALVLQLSPSHS